MPSHTAYTAKLDEDWDIQLDSRGNLLMCTGAEAIVQNVANECRLFRHDAYLRYEDGIDWFDDQLGKSLQKTVVTSRLRDAALRVNGVQSVQSVEIDQLETTARLLSGKLEITTEDGENVRAEI